MAQPDLPGAKNGPTKSKNIGDAVVGASLTKSPSVSPHPLQQQSVDKTKSTMPNIGPLLQQNQHLRICYQRAQQEHHNQHNHNHHNHNQHHHIRHQLQLQQQQLIRQEWQLNQQQQQIQQQELILKQQQQQINYNHSILSASSSNGTDDKPIRSTNQTVKGLGRKKWTDEIRHKQRVRELTIGFINDKGKHSSIYTYCKSRHFTYIRNSLNRIMAKSTALGLLRTAANRRDETMVKNGLSDLNNIIPPRDDDDECSSESAANEVTDDSAPPRDDSEIWV